MLPTGVACGGLGGNSSASHEPALFVPMSLSSNARVTTASELIDQSGLLRGLAPSSVCCDD